MVSLIHKLSEFVVCLSHFNKFHNTEFSQGSYGLVKLAYSEEDSIHYAMKILSKRKLLRKAGLMGRGPKKGIQKEGTSPLDRVYREIAVLKKVCDA